MYSGVIAFPDFDCGRELLIALSFVSSNEMTPILPSENNLSRFKIVFISGGSNWLDYIKYKKIDSSIIEAIFDYAEKGGILIGTGEGFNLLCKLKLLPGFFSINKTGRFISKNVFLKINNTNTALTCRVDKEAVLKIPLSCSYGNYQASDSELIKMRQNSQIVFHYCDEYAKVTEKINYTGSIDNIAAISNVKGNIFGIYPRPELAVKNSLGNNCGLSIFKSVFSKFD
jgi:phosphoribosylformylglycinamidine synthase subunit PurQ / glutaminase